MIEDRAAYYDALGRERAVDQRFGAAGLFGTFLRPLNFTFEEFRYDALGRRVLARTRRFCQNVPTSFECAVETIRRTVWDGAQELAEIQMPGGDSVPATTLESDGRRRNSQWSPGSGTSTRTRSSGGSRTRTDKRWTSR
jgi:hypothetical protein